jgi:hypothetical protein
MLSGEANGHATFADGGGDHLRRPRADIARGEDAGPARLEQEGLRLSFSQISRSCAPRGS